MAETWRVADLAPNAPAHLMNPVHDASFVTACGWHAPAGKYITRTSMLNLSRFACSCCLRAARR